MEKNTFSNLIIILNLCITCQMKCAITFKKNNYYLHEYYKKMRK